MREIATETTFETLLKEMEDSGASGWAYRLGQLRAELAKEREAKEDAESKVCDGCSPDNYGWKFNAVEGRHVCSCISESEAYQELLQQKEAAEAHAMRAVNVLKEIAIYKKGVSPVTPAGIRGIAAEALRSLPDYAAKYQALVEACELLQDVWADKPVVSTGVLHGVVDQVCEAVRQLKED